MIRFVTKRKTLAMPSRHEHILKPLLFLLALGVAAGRLLGISARYHRRYPHYFCD
jgi:hypothetical protein